MFDTETAQLIRTAPALTGVDPNTLPQELTDAYAQLVALRLRTGSITDDAEYTERLVRLRRIAAIYEAAVDRGTEGATRRAAAFVAATSQQILARVYESSNRIAEALSVGFVHPSVASPLLFLISEQSPDAREAARVLRNSPKSDTIRDALVESIHDLATENLVEILDRARRLSATRPAATTTSTASAMQALYGQCLAGLIHMVALLLGREAPLTEFLRFDSPQEAFDTVIALATSDLNISLAAEGGRLASDYAGPRHLARLLRHVADALADAGLSRLSAPGGVVSPLWGHWLQHRARTKPLLWRNHRSAIATGFLDVGQSAVLVLPTGAGKTTLSELKIASTLAAEKKVIFLVPTLALVDQLRDDLAESFPSSLENVEVAADGDLAALTAGTPLRSIEVMTPERCLAMLSYADADVSDVGLVVFDECHLLSPKGGGSRSLDAMLCLLHVLKRMRDADLLLLSAMLTNFQEVGDWLANVTARRCIAFYDAWKPSRQARGVVVYPRTELVEVARAARLEQAAKEKIKKDKAKAKGAGQPFTSPRPAKASLAVSPYALFGLQQNWHPAAPTDTRLVRLTTEQVELAFGKNYLTPNANAVGAALASRAGKTGLKVILFVQQADHAPSTAKKVAADASGAHTLTQTESALWTAIVAETGGEEHSLVDPRASALPHNGDMLSLERRFAESLFRRIDGINVIVATPTLAQGMNLPVQLALLAGDKRHSDNGREDLERHEVLNAAGRAGRAGILANGSVLLIPEPIVAFDSQSLPEPPAFQKLGVVLPSSDQCVEVDDPLSELLDRIQSQDTLDPRVRYVLSRLQAGEETIDGEGKAIEIVQSSLSAYRAKVSNAEAEFDARVSALRTALAQYNVAASSDVRRMSAFSGIALEALTLVETQIKNTLASLPDTITGWSDWLIDFLAANEHHLGLMLASEIEVLKFVARGEKVGGPITLAEFASLKKGVRAWLEGLPLNGIEKALGAPDVRLGRCPRARDLVLKVANRTFYLIIGAISDLAVRAYESDSRLPPNPAVLETLSVAFRKGFDTPAKVALADLRPEIRSRVLLHVAYHNRYSTFESEPGSDYTTIRAQISLRELGLE
jgi:ATP-dependent RNA helicase HelY